MARELVVVEDAESSAGIVVEDVEEEDVSSTDRAAPIELEFVELKRKRATEKETGEPKKLVFYFIK